MHFYRMESVDECLWLFYVKIWGRNNMKAVNTLSAQIPLFSWTAYDDSFKVLVIRYTENSDNCVVPRTFVILGPVCRNRREVES
jgi:hypothetical protein